MMMKVYVIVMSLACIAFADTSYFLTDAVDSIQGREKRAASDLIRIAVLTPEEISGIVDAHNDFRRLQNSSNMRLMSWDSDIAQVAQNWVRNCEFAHSPRNTRVTTDFPNPLGENVYISYTSSSVLSQAGISTVTQAWYDEISDYNYEDNSCTGVCGHYTQVVWDDDHKIGCAAAFCEDPRFDHSFLVSCNYGAGGNYVGQHPYDKGPACSECGGSDFCVDGLCGNTNRRDQPPTTTTSTTSTEPSTTSTEPSTTSTEPPTSSTTSTEPPTSSTTSTEPSTTSTEPSTSSTTSTEPSTTSTEPPTSSTTSTEPSTSSTEPSTSSTEPSTSSTVLPTGPPTGTPFSTVTPPTGGCASEHLQEWRSEFRRWKEAFNQYLEKYEDPNPDPNNCE